MGSEIERLINEGWRPRIKKKKNRRYITVRKGNKERSFGPYTDELWEKVKPVDPLATSSQILELEKRIDESTRAFDTLLLNFEKMRRELLTSSGRRLRGVNACRHMDKDGVCYSWSYPRNSSMTAAYLGPMKRYTHNGKIVYLVRVKDHPIVCSACPSYESNK